MSCFLGPALMKSLRQQQSAMLDVYGVSVTLYIVNNASAVESLDAYKTTDDYTFTTVSTKAFINWHPDQYKLRKLGLYTEGNLPITAEFKWDLVIPIGSYFTIALNFPNGTATDSTDSEEYEIINSNTNGMLDTMVFPTYSIAPRRKQ